MGTRQSTGEDTAGEDTAGEDGGQKGSHLELSLVEYYGTCTCT